MRAISRTRAESPSDAIWSPIVVYLAISRRGRVGARSDGHGHRTRTLLENGARSLRRRSQGGRLGADSPPHSLRPPAGFLASGPMRASSAGSPSTFSRRTTIGGWYRRHPKGTQSTPGGDQLAQLLDDGVQEGLERHLSVGNPAHGGFPESRHVRFGCDRGQALYKRAPDRRRSDFAPTFLDKLALEEGLDDLRLRGGRSDAIGFAQEPFDLRIVDKSRDPGHCLNETRVGEALSRRGLLVQDRYAGTRYCVALAEERKRWRGRVLRGLVGLSRLLGPDRREQRPPALRQRAAPRRAEPFTDDLELDLRLLELERWEELRQVPARDQLVHAALGGRKVAGGGRDLGRDDRVVSGHLPVVPRLGPS